MGDRDYFYVDVWALMAGRTKPAQPMMLSTTGYKQVRVTVEQHLQDSKINAIFAGNPYHMIQSAQAAMVALDFDPARQPVMNVSLSTLWVDDFHLPTEDVPGYRALVAGMISRYGSRQTPFSALRSAASDQTETVTRMFRVNLDEMVRRTAVLALRKQQDRAGLLVVTESPLPESLMVGHSEKPLLRPGDLVRLYYKVPLVDRRPYVHIPSDALYLDSYHPCPYYDRD